MLSPLHYFGIPDAPWEGIVSNYFKSIAFGEPIISSSSVAIPKQIFAECGVFYLGEKLGEDQDCWLRIALKHPIAFSTRICSFYYIDADNRATFTNYAIEGYRLVSTALEAEQNGVVTGADAFYLREYANRHLLISAWHCILAGQPRMALRHLHRCETRLFKRRKLWCMVWACVPSFVTKKIKKYVKSRRVAHSSQSFA